ncbi:MAG: hypothetical protein GY903_17155 [Fuerstiella sp.]|nr:hypothetical protein [Fuerstiella sp.]MCP4856212.1 hypothetical protein [Fuerstiella sp.]
MVIEFYGPQRDRATRSVSPSGPAVQMRVGELRPTDTAGRISFFFSPATVDFARWIPGDRVVIGVDVEAHEFAVRRDPANGYVLAGQSFLVGKPGRTKVTILADHDSDLWALAKYTAGDWVVLDYRDGMLVADCRSTQATD